jgi:flavorubredoxin
LIMNRNLVLYTSHTGNTHQVALALERGFARHGWQSTLIRLAADHDPHEDPVDFEAYDFVCVGSPVIDALPVTAVRQSMRSVFRPRHKLVPGPKCGLVFCTYSGIHLGPEEAGPALALLALELAHLRFNVIGRLAVPGKMGNLFTPDWYHGVMVDRPDADDLARVDRFVDGIMEQLSAR